MKRRQILSAVAAVSLGALVAPSPALAAEAATGVAQAQLAAALPAPAIVADPAAADRAFVQWLSVHDPRAAVRSAAQEALGGGTAAVTTFLSSGYKAATDQAAQTRTRLLEYATGMAAAHPASSFPWVNAAARRAATGTDAELAEFSETGYAAALAKDDAAIPYDDGAAQVTEADHDYVYGLSRIDPGPAVRERAAGVETDADVAEFLRHGWLSAAGSDLDAFRAQYVADEWSRWREARQATLSAVAAEQAARQGGSPAAAIRAWDNVRTRFARQPAGWTERERFARARVDDWSRTALSAGDSESPLWSSIAVGAPDVRGRWIAEITGAREQSAWWSGLIEYARAAAAAWLDRDA